jgi:predicted nucleotidyltransferase
MSQPASVPDDPLWEGTAEVDQEVFRRVFDQTASALRASGVTHLFMGGLVSAALGRERWTHDIDVFVKPEDAREALEALRQAGFETQETDPSWLFTAVKEHVLVDLIFLSDGRIVVDDEMVHRARQVEVQGRTVPAIPVEDLIVVKALVHKERSPWHWFDALALLRRDDLDWDYLVRRGVQYGPHRILSLLFYARSRGRDVPMSAVRELLDLARPPEVT